MKFVWKGKSFRGPFPKALEVGLNKPVSSDKQEIVFPVGKGRSRGSSHCHGPARGPAPSSREVRNFPAGTLSATGFHS